MINQYINESKYIVFFGGAGVSTESGIPDFRSKDGLYAQKYKYPPEVILSNGFFMSNTKEFFDFYRQKILIKNVRPNSAHLKLAQIEEKGKLKAVITQNIDGLHQAAGSKEVLELHGSIHRNNCMKCGKFYHVDVIESCDGVPMCGCGGIIKPDVVLYDESLNSNILSKAMDHLLMADLLIVGGTSLSVYPAAGLLTYFKGGRIILINSSETSYDSQADLVIRDKIGTVLNNIEVV